jgi:hypothetical protein
MQETYTSHDSLRPHTYLLTYEELILKNTYVHLGKNRLSMGKRAWYEPLEVGTTGDVARVVGARGE